jgi:glutamate carboxypeptidase
MKALAALLSLAIASPASAGLDALERKIADAAEREREPAIAFLEKIVNVNSGTLNTEGVREVGRIIERRLEPLGFKSRWVDMPESMRRAGHLHAELEGGSGKRLLLIGHLDTVFEKDGPFQTFRRDGATGIGPGVNDMKGGIAVIVHALAALKAAGALDGKRISIVLHGDEEDSGHPLEKARELLIAQARESDAALGFEYAVETIQKATIARRGSSSWRLSVEGKRGHSSRVFSEEYGAGAIYALSDILSRFYRKLGGERLLTFNPGLAAGGTAVDYDKETKRVSASGKTNVIAQTALAKGDLRAISVKQRERAKSRMRKIVSKTLPGTSAAITFNDSYPPMPPTAGNKRLLAELSRASEDLGYGPVEALDPGRRGAADTSFAAPYADALDGLGLLGDGAHTENEKIDLEALPKSVARAALLIHRLCGK